MGQDEIEAFLRDNRGNYFTARELAEIFSLTCSTISTNCRRLQKWGRIEVMRNAKGVCHYTTSSQEHKHKI